MTAIRVHDLLELIGTPPRIQKVGTPTLEMLQGAPLEMKSDQPPLEPKIGYNPLLCFAFLAKYFQARNCIFMTPSKTFRHPKKFFFAHRVGDRHFFIEGYQQDYFFPLQKFRHLV